MTRLFLTLVAAGLEPDYDNDDLHSTRYEGRHVDAWRCPVTGPIDYERIRLAAEVYLPGIYMHHTIERDELGENVLLYLWPGEYSE